MPSRSTRSKCSVRLLRPTSAPISGPVASSDTNRPSPASISAYSTGTMRPPTTTRRRPAGIRSGSSPRLTAGRRAPGTSGHTIRPPVATTTTEGRSTATTSGVASASTRTTTLRAEAGRDLTAPYDVVVALTDAITHDDFARAAAGGVTLVMTTPWLYYYGTTTGRTPLSSRRSTASGATGRTSSTRSVVPTTTATWDRVRALPPAPRTCDRPGHGPAECSPDARLAVAREPSA